MYTDVVSESLSLFMYRHEVHVRFSLFIKFLFSPSMLILGLFCLLFSLCLCLSLSPSLSMSLSPSLSLSLSLGLPLRAGGWRLLPGDPGLRLYHWQRPPEPQRAHPQQGVQADWEATQALPHHQCRSDLTHAHPRALLFARPTRLHPHWLNGNLNGSAWCTWRFRTF